VDLGFLVLGAEYGKSGYLCLWLGTKPDIQWVPLSLGLLLALKIPSDKFLLFQNPP
jgi:hypothetical protein